MINKPAGIDVYSDVTEIEPVRSRMQIVRNSKIKRRVEKTNETEEIQEREPPAKKNKPDTATPATNKKTLAPKAAPKRAASTPVTATKPADFRSTALSTPGTP